MEDSKAVSFLMASPPVATTGTARANPNASKNRAATHNCKRPDHDSTRQKKLIKWCKHGQFNGFYARAKPVVIQGNVTTSAV